MSEAMDQIQTSSPDELSGGQTPEQALAADLRSRQGHNCPQNTMSFVRGTQTDIPSGQAAQVKPNLQNGAATRPTDLNSGMSLNGVGIGVKPVDSRTVEGSFPGDHRAPSRDSAAASLRSAADNGGPRNPAGQARLTNKLDTPQVASYPAPENGD